MRLPVRIAESLRSASHTGRRKNGFSIPPDELEGFVHQERADVFVFSNPCNPTGEVMSGQDLDRYVGMARRENCLLGSDEFYSHFIYEADGSPASGPISAAACVGDVDKDPVVIFDGLTKSHRYPGWRCGWAVGPKHIIEMLNRAASAVDGGPSMLAQRATLAAPGRPGAWLRKLQPCVRNLPANAD